MVSLNPKREKEQVGGLQKPWRKDDILISDDYHRGKNGVKGTRGAPENGRTCKNKENKSQGLF